MPIFYFLVYSTLGTIIWISFLTVVGYWLGDNYILVEEFMAPISIIVFVILFFAVVIWFLKRKKQQ
jgi:membrane protein DedA with SNARE-associated domain